MSSAYVWLPERKPGFSEVEGQVYDDNGHSVTLIEGSKISSGRSLNITVSDRGTIPDFLFNLRLQLIVSGRAMEILSSVDIRSSSWYIITLRDQQGRAVDDYYWMSVSLLERLLDPERSRIERTSSGHLLTVSFFAVREDACLTEDVVICKETKAKIFSERLVDRVIEESLLGCEFIPLEGSTWPV